MSNTLVIPFSEKTSAAEVERKNLKEIAEKLGVTETKAVHIAINRLHREFFPERHPEAGDYPTDSQLESWEKAGLIQRTKPGEKSDQLAGLFGAGQ